MTFLLHSFVVICSGCEYNIHSHFDKLFCQLQKQKNLLKKLKEMVFMIVSFPKYAYLQEQALHQDQCSPHSYQLLSHF